MRIARDAWRCWDRWKALCTASTAFSGQQPLSYPAGNSTTRTIVDSAHTQHTPICKTTTFAKQMQNLALQYTFPPGAATLSSRCRSSPTPIQTTAAVKWCFDFDAAVPAGLRPVPPGRLHPLVWAENFAVTVVRKTGEKLYSRC